MSMMLEVVTPSLVDVDNQSVWAERHVLPGRVGLQVGFCRQVAEDGWMSAVVKE